MHRFYDIAKYWSKVTHFSYATCIWRPRWGDSTGILPRSLASENYRVWIIVRRCCMILDVTPFWENCNL